MAEIHAHFSSLCIYAFKLIILKKNKLVSLFCSPYVFVTSVFLTRFMCLSFLLSISAFLCERLGLEFLN